MASVEDRIRGSLLGLAYGDVLGCPLETWKQAQIQEVFGDYQTLPKEYPYEKIIDVVPERLKRLRPIGLHSDDTQQALALVSICLGAPRFSRHVFGDWLVEGSRTKAWRGYGRHFNSAVKMLKKGHPPEHAGSASAGIGAAMRITPIGALYYDDPDELERVVMESSLVTHAELRAAAIAYAAAWVTAAFIRGEDLEVIRSSLGEAVYFAEETWIHEREDWRIDRDSGHQVSRGLEMLLAAEPKDRKELRELIVELAEPHLAEGFKDAHPNQGFAMLGGPHGILMALERDADPHEVLVDVIAQGEDTDTVAAIAGGILGARFGTEWIDLEGMWDLDRLELYADAMVKREEAPEHWMTYMAREAHWSREEDAFQKELREEYAFLEKPSFKESTGTLSLFEKLDEALEDRSNDG